MKTSFRQSFARELKRIRDRARLNRVREAIEQVEAADDLRGVAELKKLSGAPNF